MMSLSARGNGNGGIAHSQSRRAGPDDLRRHAEPIRDVSRGQAQALQVL